MRQQTAEPGRAVLPGENARNKTNSSRYGYLLLLETKGLRPDLRRNSLLTADNFHTLRPCYFPKVHALAENAFELICC